MNGRLNNPFDNFRNTQEIKTEILSLRTTQEIQARLTDEVSLVLGAELVRSQQSHTDTANIFLGTGRELGLF